MSKIASVHHLAAREQVLGCLEIEHLPWIIEGKVQKKLPTDLTRVYIMLTIIFFVTVKSLSMREDKAPL